jgi:hypothetical protein
LCFSRVFQQSYPVPTYEMDIFFQQSHPISPMKAGIEWCAALCDPSFVCLREYFSTVLPISTYESRDWVMCCSFVISLYVWS